MESTENKEDVKEASDYVRATTETERPDIDLSKNQQVNISKEPEQCNNQAPRNDYRQIPPNPNMGSPANGRMGFNPYQGNQTPPPPMNPYIMQQPPVGTSAPEFVQWLILSIVELLCCSQIPGIIALVFICMANSAFKQGNIRDYMEKLKYCKITLAVGLGIGVVANIVILFIYVFIAMASTM